MALHAAVGLACGLESAVVSLNRFPKLGVAISRRCAFCLTAAYFDDQLALQAVAQGDVSQAGLRLTFSLFWVAQTGYQPASNRQL